MKIEDLAEGQRIEFIDDYRAQTLKVHKAYNGDKGEITCVNTRYAPIDSQPCAWVKLDDGRFVYLAGELPVKAIK